MTREEALNEIRSWAIPSEKGREVLETLIPELAESEDKRMVVKIARTLSFAAAHNLITDYDELIAMQNWLEKQKENSEYVFRPLAGTDVAIAAEQVIRKAKEGDRLVLAFNGFYTPVTKHDSVKRIVDEYDSFIERQKEQKPDSLIYDKDLDKAAREFYLSGGADSPFDSTGLVPIVRMAEFGATWMKERMEKEQKPCWNPTEEDVALFNKAITTNASLSPQERAKLDILRMKFKHRPVIEQKEQKFVDLHDKIEELCSKYPINKYSMSDEELSTYYQGIHLGARKIAEYLNEQKSVEWSEEDEDMKDTIIRDLKHLGGDMVNVSPAYKEEIDWLKALRPQPKQDWSEEDKRALNNAIVALSMYANGEIPYLLPSQLLEDVERLKSFRPSWKPSKEQMEAVKHAYNSFPNGCSTKSNLRCLYFDLKKLGVREEPEYYQHFDPDC